LVMKQEHYPPRFVEKLRRYSYYIFILGYLVTLTVFSLYAGSFWTPSTTFFLVAAALLGSLGLDKPWTRPWLALAIIGLSFQVISGPIDALGDSGGVYSLFDLDKYAWGFNLTGWTQSSFSSEPVTVASSFVYAALIPFVSGTSFAIWRYRRRNFARFATAMVLTSYGALLTFVLMPTAPPWFSGVASNLFRGSGLDAVSGVFAPLSTLVVPDYFAAFPSLHAAYSITCCYFLSKVDYRLGLVGGLVAGATLFSTLYLGQHYAIDLVGGAVYSLIPCLVSERWGPRGEDQVRNPAGAGLGQ
jgi:membrane-associated phospholipid phosphatase